MHDVGYAMSAGRAGRQGLARAVVTAAVLLFAAATVSSSGGAAGAAPGLRETTCWRPAPRDLVMRCAWVDVPERRDVPTRRRVELAIAILTAPGGQPAGAPTILLAGGPGGGAIDDIVGAFDQIERYRESPPSEAWQRDLLARAIGALDGWRRAMASRPMVLLDQRGTGHSRPSLDCPEEDLRSCRSRLLAQGVDLTAYTTEENAHDVDAVRQALRYPTMNLDGGSYGTRLGLEVLRRHGDRVRAAVFEGLAPPQLSPDLEQVRGYGRALATLFDACAVDPSCATAYPGLEATFYDAVTRLDRTPLQVPVRGGSGAAEVTLSGQVLRQIVWQGLFAGDPIPWLPLLIVEAAGGRPTAVGEYLSRAERADEGRLAAGMRWSVQCPTLATLTVEDLWVASAGLHPAVRSQVVDEYRAPLAICRLWDVPPAASASRSAVTSDRPVLLLSGWFDPGTPPAFAEITARTLSRAVSTVLPGVGHTQGFFTPCGQWLRGAFLDDPTAPLDTSCVAAMPGVRFVVPRDGSAIH
jgi:pimeloyl-ACP methyl ester carboxylesterase